MDYSLRIRLNRYKMKDKRKAKKRKEKKRKEKCNKERTIKRKAKFQLKRTLFDETCVHSLAPEGLHVPRPIIT